MQAEPKRLKRDVDNKMIAGVCSGIATYFGIDPTIVRLAAVLFACMGGGGVLAYIVAWIIIPSETV